MPPLPNDLRRFLPPDFSIIYLLKSERIKCVVLLLLIMLASLAPYWTMSCFYLKNSNQYLNSGIPYGFESIRCFWMSCFVLVIIHPIFHIRPGTLLCITFFIFLIFLGISSFLTYFYVQNNNAATFFHIHHFDINNQLESSTICHVFNCSVFTMYHFTLFILIQPLMLMVALLFSFIYLKCFTVYGTISSMQRVPFSVLSRFPSHIQ